VPGGAVAEVALPRVNLGSRDASWGRGRLRRRDGDDRILQFRP